MDDAASIAKGFPKIACVGLDGMLVSFANALTENANRAALAFRAAVEAEGWDGVEETSASLASTFVRLDPLHVTHQIVQDKLQALLRSTDWYHAALPGNRQHWHIPVVFGGDLAPQFNEAAEMAGLTPAEALTQLSQHECRVLATGFAPGQPYLGTLPPAWDIPRQSGLTPQVPQGALAVAVRQFVLFTTAATTGWRHVGQTAFECFRPEAADPFPLHAGDIVSFDPVDEATLNRIRQDDTSGNGGARRRPVT